MEKMGGVIHVRTSLLILLLKSVRLYVGWDTRSGRVFCGLKVREKKTMVKNCDLGK